MMERLLQKFKGKIIKAWTKWERNYYVDIKKTNLTGPDEKTKGFKEWKEESGMNKWHHHILWGI